MVNMHQKTFVYNLIRKKKKITYGEIAEILYKKYKKPMTMQELLKVIRSNWRINEVEQWVYEWRNEKKLRQDLYNHLKTYQRQIFSDDELSKICRIPKKLVHKLIYRISKEHKHIKHIIFWEQRKWRNPYMKWRSMGYYAYYPTKFPEHWQKHPRGSSRNEG